MNCLIKETGVFVFKVAVLVGLFTGFAYFTGLMLALRSLL